MMKVFSIGRRVRMLVVVPATAVLAVSCAQRRYVITDAKQLQALEAAWDDRGSWPPLDRLDYEIPLYAKYLKGLRICLDPGHGGDAHIPRYKRGPTDFREAVVNWGVTLSLKDFLERSGAEVVLTRHGDEDVSLAERAGIANEWPADIFLSIHHNAVDNPKVNRTTTWFHGEQDERPSSLDLARYIQQGVADALRLPQVDGNPLKSDYMMYPGAGFGVLRPLRMTGCLCEASFFTNPWEEYRLSREWYWKREAYGLFLGLARYAWAGIPHSMMLEPAAGAAIQQKEPMIRLQARTGLEGRGSWASEKAWILSESVSVRLDGSRIPHEFDPETGGIVARVESPLAAGEHRVVAGFRNYNGNYSRPEPHRFIVDPPVDRLTISMTPTAIPPGGEGPCRIRIRVTDAEGEPVLDGTPVMIGASGGNGESFRTATRGGEAFAYLVAPAEAGTVKVAAVSGGRFAVADVPVEAMPDRALVAARVSDASTGEPVSGAECVLSVAGQTEKHHTESDGWFFASTELAGPGSFSFMKGGYYRAGSRVVLERNASSAERVRLWPVLDGVLRGKRIVLDGRYGGSETGERAADGSAAAAWNLELAEVLAGKLREAGAEGVLIRTRDEAMTPEERVRRANRQRGADLYIRLDHRRYGSADHGMHVDIYPNSTGGRGIAAAVIEQATRELGVVDGGVTGVKDHEIDQTRMLAVSVAPFTMDHPSFAGWPRAAVIDAEAGVVLRGVAAYYGWSAEGKHALTVRVPESELERSDELRVRLGGALTARIRPDGTCRFPGLRAHGYEVELVGPSGEVLARGEAEVDEETVLPLAAAPPSPGTEGPEKG